MAKRGEPLSEYARKRDFAKTPEPSGSKRSVPKRSLRFVIQKHRATRLHYDFRLEAGGVLASWAVPKGPSLDTKERRLAMHVEDHPLDYRDFEGIIPEGNYGAGEVIVWDRGTYHLVEGSDPVAEIAGGKIKFILAGKKLKGMFTLVKIRAQESGEPWLLIKDRDEHVDPSWDVEAHAESAKTGRTLAEIAHSPHVQKWISNRSGSESKAAARKPASKRSPRVKNVKLPIISSPQLATPIDAAFDDPDWLFELKWDGYRALARIEADGTVALTSRNGNDLLRQFPELAGLAEALESRPAILDGEIVSLDAEGRPSFQRLQNRVESAGGNRRAAADAPVTFVAFDLLFGDGRDLRGLPLEERKTLLEALIVPEHGVMYSKHVVEKGIELYRFADERGLEGIVGKRRGATYQERRTKDWVKIKAVRRQEFVVGGWTEPRGSRSGFGALLVGVYERSKPRAKPVLVYAGHVGTGFDAKKIASLAIAMKSRERADSPFASTPKTNTRAHWCEPELIAELKFTEWTRDGVLRHPVYLGLREDKDPRSVVREIALDRDDIA